MIDHLLQFDKHLFYFINHDLGNAFFDWLMPILREPRTWILYIILALILAFAIADSGSAGLGKHIFKRLRPCNDPTMASTIITRIPCGTGYSFPSAHASNHFALAVLLCLIFGKKWRWTWLLALLWASLICFAQVYVGVHYPIDVTTGALYGTLVGWLTYQLFKKLQPDF